MANLVVKIDVKHPKACYSKSEVSAYATILRNTDHPMVNLATNC